MAMDFEEKSHSFLQWLEQIPAAHVSRKITLADLRSGAAGRGVVALEDIDEDEDLFTIPRSSLISVENSDLQQKLPNVLEELDPWLALILVLIYEYRKGPESHWKPYFDVLPQHFDSLMFWTPEELAELQASAVVQKIGKESADETFRSQIVPVVQAHPDVFSSDSGLLSDSYVLALAHRMGSTIMAYAFDLEKDESKQEEDEDGFITDDEDEALPKGMVPLADMLNANADRNNARLFYGPATLTMKSLKPVMKGEELFNDYGPLPRSDLLRRYGYITPNYAQYDVVELSTAAIATAAAEQTGLTPKDQEKRLEYLTAHDILDDAYDLSHPSASSPPSCFPPDLLILVNTLLLSAPAYKTHRSARTLPSPNLSATAAQILQKVLKHRAAEYGTDIRTDESLLSRDSGLSPRTRLAVEVRLGEKRILEEAFRELEVVLAESQGSSSAALPGRKRSVDPDADGPSASSRRPRIR
ncbi:MAG: hypothetical protein M1819_007209 [Sarea resinae]|nr:MAG: hypothetical protein M1819_007209 [Sarea resinae]